VIRHVRRLQASGQLRFRAETFGLYFPAFPDSRAWLLISPSPMKLLLGQARAYSTWRREMCWVVTSGPHEWWGRQWPAIDMEGEYARRLKGDAN
jgi:hypothetical protein